jgi:methionyl-tRNA formyltransferase
VRVLVLGSTIETARHLEGIVEAGHVVVGLVTRPPARRRRGGPVEPSPAAQGAARHGVPVLEELPEDHGGAEVCVVVAYGRILPAAWLAGPPVLNVHYSLLPRWRGAAPVERAILAGEDATGVSVIRLVPELDAGPLLAQAAVAIDGLRASAARGRMTEAGLGLLLGLLDRPPSLEAGWAQPEGTTWAPRIGTEDLRLRPAETAEQWERRVRLERAFGFVGARRVVVRAGRAVADEGSESLGDLRLEGHDAFVRTARGSFFLEEVVPEGGRPMSGAAFLRGLRDRLAMSPVPRGGMR